MQQMHTNKIIKKLDAILTNNFLDQKTSIENVYNELNELSQNDLMDVGAFCKERRNMQFKIDFNKLHDIAAQVYNDRSNSLTIDCSDVNVTITPSITTTSSNTNSSLSHYESTFSESSIINTVTYIKGFNITKYIDEYVDKTTDEVTVFSGFEQTINYLPEIKKTKKGTISKATKDKLAVFCSWCYQRDHAYKFIGRDKFKAIDKKSYKKNLDHLRAGTKDQGPIIERSSNYVVGERPYGYRLSTKYTHRKGVQWKLNKAVPVYKEAEVVTKLTNIKNEVMCQCLLESYKRVTIPTMTEVYAKSTKMVGTTTKKGKKRIYVADFLAEKPYYRDLPYDKIQDMLNENHYSSLERDINCYATDYIKGNKIIPSKAKCGRVSDIFTGMATWIRDEVLIDGEETAECDYTALHPNLWRMYYTDLPLAEQKVYDEYIAGDAHTKIAKYLGVERVDVKREFLTFFNVSATEKGEVVYKGKISHWIPPMNSFKVYKFFAEKMPTLLSIIKKSKQGPRGHAGTSDWLFGQEALLVEDVLFRLHNLGIAAFQVYDAVIVAKSNQQVCIDIMNDVVKEQNLKTYAH